MKYDLDKCEFEQGFGVNPAVYGPELKGHPGDDLSKGSGTPITNPVDQTIYKVLTVAEPANDGSGFTGVFGIVDDGIECYELLFGHCDPAVWVGQFAQKGITLGHEANHGLVFANGVQITLAMQKAGDKRGAHRHVQKKPVMKVLHADLTNFRYLSAYSDWPAGSIYRDLDGFYYQIWNYNNGFHGCIDPAKSVFGRDLTDGASGYDVYVLQRILVKEKIASFAPTGFFGPLTKAALMKFQSRIGIHPDVGYFGPLTRSAVVGIYNV